MRPEVNGDLVLDVLPAMMMYRHKTTGRDLSDKDMDELVDQVMVPLLQGQ